jgi:hypothetical protein
MAVETTLAYCDTGNNYGFERFTVTASCGLYYKNITVINDASKIVSKCCSKLWRHL